MCGGGTTFTLCTVPTKLGLDRNIEAATSASSVPEWFCAATQATSLFETSSAKGTCEPRAKRLPVVRQMPTNRQRSAVAATSRKLISCSGGGQAPQVRKNPLPVRVLPQLLLRPKIIFARDLQALHFGLQGSPLQTEAVGGAGRSGDLPSAFP